MLVLKRKVNEEVEITTPAGDVIYVCLVRIDCGSARIGFRAASDVKILRTEVLDREAERPAQPEPVA